MSEIPKAYEPQSVEDKWYDFWLKHGCFTADPARVTDKRPAYSIVIPSPNVTGMLHLGHVLNNSIQDILSRKARMDGKEVLWLPGTKRVKQGGKWVTVPTVTWTNSDLYQLVAGQPARANGLTVDSSGSVFASGWAADATGEHYWIVRRQ